MNPADPRPVVAVLFGGRSSEHSVSCVTAAGVLGALDEQRYRVLPIGMTREGVCRIVEEARDFRFDPEAMPEVVGGLEVRSRRAVGDLDNGGVELVVSDGVLSPLTGLGRAVSDGRDLLEEEDAEAS